LLGAGRQNPPFVGIMSNGTSGDVNNIDFSGQRPRRKPYEQMRLVADKVAAEVFRVSQTIDYHDWVPLGMLQREIRLGVRHPSPEQLARSERIVADSENASKYSSSELGYARRLIEIPRLYPKEVDIVLQTVQIGDLGVGAIPAEVFAEIGLEIKEKSPFKPTFVIELANDQWVYLPTPRQHELGGYETWMGTNLLEVNAAPKIVQTLLDLFTELRGRRSDLTGK
jgi:neutral ceramidase